MILESKNQFREGVLMKQAFTPHSETAQRILAQENTPLVIGNIQFTGELKQKVMDVIDREFPNNLTELARMRKAQELLQELNVNIKWITTVLSPVTRDYLAECYPAEWTRLQKSILDIFEFFDMGLDLNKEV